MVTRLAGVRGRGQLFALAVALVVGSSGPVASSFESPRQLNRGLSRRWRRMDRRPGSPHSHGGLNPHGATSTMRTMRSGAVWGRQRVNRGGSSDLAAVANDQAVEGRVLASTEEIQAPDCDTKAYRVISLPKNGLRVTLVSDPGTAMGGAAVNIHGGSFQDSEWGIDGLAHLHEHMLFLGTERYPGENEFEGFLSQHGGFSNAYTADEDTNFYMEVGATAMRGALDRFAQFFLAPTLGVDMVARETNAIDSEHQNYLREDGWRLNQVGLRAMHARRSVCVT